MKLTEDIVMQRLRNSSPPLEAITQINITGRELDEISLVQRMTAIEVLSLSVNKISSLRDLQYCKFLKELYLRKNNISDLNEIYYIQDLPNLIILGLSQNPCSNSPHYRMTIIRNLPKLERLDDIQIVPEERVKALKRGMKVINPEEDVGESDSLLSDDGLLPPQSPKKLPDENTQPQDFSTVPPDSKPDEPDKVINYHSSRSRLPANTVSNCFRIDSYSPDRPLQEIPIADKGNSPGGVGHSNLLPGILVLVTDLDYYSLEILSINIKNRLNEYRANNLTKL